MIFRRNSSCLIPTEINIETRFKDKTPNDMTQLSKMTKSREGERTFEELKKQRGNKIKTNQFLKTLMTR